MGLVRLADLPDDLFPEEQYRPAARLSEGQLLKSHATCCMDTSDGLLATLDQLMRLNGVGFEIECDWPRILTPRARDLCDRTHTPPWLMIAGPHGEFELVFTVPASREAEFLSVAQSRKMSPVRLGTVQQSPGISLALPSGPKVAIDMAPLRNLLQMVEGDLSRFLREFREFERKWGLE